MCVLGWISRSHARDWNEIQTPGHCWLPAKRWDAWFLNSSKSKTRLKFRKLGSLSWSGINMPWYNFCPNSAKNFTTSCSCHVMTLCQVSWFSGVFWIYKNFKTKYLNVLGRATLPRCLNFIPISCMWPRNSRQDTHAIFQPTLVHGSMCL